jgi:hypothetical protein
LSFFSTGVSKGTLIVAGVLVLAIVVGLVVPVKKPVTRLRTGPVATAGSAGIMSQVDKEASGGRSAEQPPAAAPAAPKPKQRPAFQPVNAASVAPMGDFELLAERYGRSDPFAPIFETPAAAPVEEVEVGFPGITPLPPMVVRNPPNFSLSAIAMRGGRGIAIVNGDILRQGDFVDEYTVKLIASDRVELVSDMGDKIILRIKQEIKTGMDDSGGASSIEITPAIPARAAKQPRKLSPVIERGVYDSGGSQTGGGPGDRPPADNVPKISP